MYLRCDGLIVVDTDDKPSCSNWVAVTDQELFSDALLSHKLTLEEYHLIGGYLIAMFLTAFGVRLLTKLLINR